MKKHRIPQSPFSTRLSGSAKETELRLRNIFQWKKKRPPVLLFLAVILAVGGCGSLIGFTTYDSAAGDVQTPDSPPQEEQPADDALLPGPETAGNRTGVDTSEAQLSLMQAFEQVLLNERSVCYTANLTRSYIYQDDLYLSEIAEEDGVTMSTPKFAVVDLDGDGAPEVVYQRGDYKGFVVLRYQEGNVYGYEMNYRAMLDLKKDGSFIGSSGASSHIFAKMRFLGNYCDTEVKAEQRNETVYYLHDEAIDRDTYVRLIAEYEELVDWHECTDDMVRQWLPYDLELLEAPAFPEPTEMQNYLDSLASLLFCHYYPGGDATDADRAASYQSYYDGWNDAMEAIYQLCLEKLSGVDREALMAEQEQWLSMRDQRKNVFSLGEMTKMRTYRLISFYFDDHFYD